jgi:septal ring factor EnvC (AmiA/AmiB activator)
MHHDSKDWMGVEPMDKTVVIALISALGGGGLVGAVATFMKVKPESGQILVSAAKDVVVIQQGAMTNMQTRIASLEQEREEWRAEREESLRRLADAERERDEMKARVAQLEADLGQLRRRVAEAE